MPKTICAEPSCNRIVDSGRCEEHKVKRDEHRGTAAQRGYGGRWQRARLSYLKQHPLCVECQKHQRIEPATVVDHIVPHRGDEDLFRDQSNWQALCKRCHDRKTARGE